MPPLSARSTPLSSRRAKKPASFQRRALPLILLAALSLYGGWFIGRAQTGSSVNHVEDEDTLIEGGDPGTYPQDEDPLSDDHDDQQQAAVQWQPQQQQQQQQQAQAQAQAQPAMNGGACSATQPAASALAMGFQGHQWLELAASEETRLDSGELTVSAWVRLPRPDGPGRDPASIQTVIASKSSGCEADTAHYGFALFVNAWNSDSGQLFLSWGNGKSGCEELATFNGAVVPGKWSFIAATIDAKGDAALYVNGALKAATADRASGHKRIASTTSPIDRGIGHHPLRVGVHTDGTHGLIGHLASVALHSAALGASELQQLMCAQHAAVRPPPLALLTPRLVGGKKSKKSLLKLASVQDAGGDASAAAEGEIDVDPMSEPPAAIRMSSGGGGDGLGADRAPQVVSIAAASAVSLRSGGDFGGGGGGGDRGGSSRRAQTKGGGTNLGPPLANGWPLSWLPGKKFPQIDAATVNASDALAYQRREQVRGVMKRAWSAYRKYAWGADELKPVSNRSHDWLKLGATMVDCLDNLWIMGMKAEFAEAREWVAKHLHFTTPKPVSMFETVIRILGGLLGAYELSRDQIFLSKSRELADKMMFAFEKNSRTGLPCTTISLSSGQCSYASWTGNAAVLAEFGTIQLEFKYLAYHTGEVKYWRVVERIMELMRRVDKPHGLYPVFMSPHSGTWTSQKITLGALGDSFYEYLVKQWLITSKKEGYLREMYDAAMLNIAKLLVQRSSPSGFVYIADWSGSTLAHKMDHLACFASGMYAVGAQDNGKFDDEYMALAEALGETCYKMYSRTATGLSPEFVQFVSGRDLVTPRTASYNIGRPEAVEAWFYMWYYTRDPKWREMGWRVFESFEKHAATGSGWTALPDVDNPRRHDDKMESFVLAETVKYFYLLFDPDYPIPLDKYVFNTEAHPLGHIEVMDTGR